MLKTFARAVETPYEKSVRKSLAASRGWPEFEITIPINAEQREFVASIGRLEGMARDDEMELSRVIKGLIVKLMAEHQKLVKAQEQEAND
jgi:hypothetical protein